jgi:hypothetical protein
MKQFLWIAVTACILAGYQRPANAEMRKVEVPDAVALRAKPILDAMVAVRKAQAKGSTAHKEWIRVERLNALSLRDESSAGCEALVVLTHFYIGEAFGEDLHHEITKRGRRMLPYLQKYRRGQVYFADRHYPDSIRLDPPDWQGNIDADIDSIQHGEVRFED